MFHAMIARTQLKSVFGGSACTPDTAASHIPTHSVALDHFTHTTASTFMRVQCGWRPGAQPCHRWVAAPRKAPGRARRRVLHIVSLHWRASWAPAPPAMGCRSSAPCWHPQASQGGWPPAERHAGPCSPARRPHPPRRSTAAGMQRECSPSSVQRWPLDQRQAAAERLSTCSAWHPLRHMAASGADQFTACGTSAELVRSKTCKHEGREAAPSQASACSRSQPQPLVHALNSQHADGALGVIRHTSSRRTSWSCDSRLRMTMLRGASSPSLRPCAAAKLSNAACGRRRRGRRPNSRRSRPGRPGCPPAHASCTPHSKDPHVHLNGRRSATACEALSRQHAWPSRASACALDAGTKNKSRSLRESRQLPHGLRNSQQQRLRVCDTKSGHVDILSCGKGPALDVFPCACLIGLLPGKL